MESVSSFLGPNGLTVRGTFARPDSESRPPLVVLFHGFTGWRDEPQIIALADALSGAGIASLRFDAPGGGDSDGSFEHDYLLTSYVNAVGPMLDFASTLDVDATRVALWGHSMGGFVALQAALLHADRIRAVCGAQPSIGKFTYLTEAEVTAWRNEGGMDFSHDRFPDLHLPFAFYEDRQQYDLLPAVRGLRVPLLLIAGTFDESAPPAQCRTIFDAAPEPKTYLEFPVHHRYAEIPDQLAAINRATVDFFERQLAD